MPDDIEIGAIVPSAPQASDRVLVRRGSSAPFSLALLSEVPGAGLSQADREKLDGIQPGATANDTNAALRARSSHTGTQPASTITGLAPVATSGAYADLTGAPELAPVATSGSASDLSTGTLPAGRFGDASHGNRAGGSLHAAATGSAAGFMSADDKTKLDGVAAGATANATDAQLRDRATHTGTQAASTITGLAAVATTGAYGDLTGRPTLGTAAAQEVGAFATAAQGATADSAVQPGDNATTLGSGAAADGFVLTSDGAGGTAWEVVSGGGGGGSTDYVRTRAGTVQDIFAMADTWNASGTTFTAIRMDVTDTASAANSRLMELLVGGSPRLRVEKSGRISTFNTFTDEANNERASFDWMSNAFALDLAGAGTGQARDFQIRIGGLLRAQFGANTSLVTGGADTRWSGGNFFTNASLAGLGINNGSWRWLYLREQTAAPTTPSADQGVLFLQDNGSGKTRLMVQFATGAAVQLAIEP